MVRSEKKAALNGQSVATNLFDTQITWIINWKIVLIVSLDVRIQ